VIFRILQKIISGFELYCFDTTGFHFLQPFFSKNTKKTGSFKPPVFFAFCLTMFFVCGIMIARTADKSKRSAGRGSASNFRKEVKAFA